MTSKIPENRPIKFCPVCDKNDQVIKIIYGYPGPDLLQNANEGKVKLGGCIMNDNFRWYCKRDKHEF